jgi:IMP dehydrogenase/GMP reductase
MHIEHELKLDFKDVLIRPKRSTLTSRSDVDIARQFSFRHGKEAYDGIPIIAANMDSTGTFEMANALAPLGLSVALHKHYAVAEYVTFFRKLERKSAAFYSIGITRADEEKFGQVMQAAGDYIGYVCLDVANGYHENFATFVARIRDAYPRLVIMAGNVVTGEMTEELEALEHQLSDTYFCNFSVFQSLPDSWAIDQLFPVMPIHRLTERPTRRAVLADITCDSDGKIEKFIDKREVKDDIQLHALNDDEYYLGIFLVGAYQEILGDLHNLFGDTHTIQVSLAPGGGYLIDRVVEGDTVTEVLNYVAYNKDDLIAKMRTFTETALRAGKITLDESRQILRVYEAGLAGYTYLEREVDAKSFTASQLRLVPTEPARDPARTGT